MTGINHALTGAVIALAIKRPELALPAAFVSHFAVDVIPHFEARDLKPKMAKLFVYCDLLAAALLIVLLPHFLYSEVSAWTVLAAMFLAVSPDLIWVLRYILLKDMDKVFEEPLSWLSRVHLRIQLSESLTGIIIEAAWAALMVFIIYRIS
jgi:hypothetical protein